MKSDPLKKRIRVSHFGNMNYLGNTLFYQAHTQQLKSVARVRFYHQLRA